MPKPEFANDRDLTVKPNENEEPIDTSDRVVGQALRIVREWQPILTRKLQQNDKIDEALEDTHTVVERDRNAPMPSYLLQAVRFKVRRRMQPPDWTLRAEGMSDEVLKLIEKAVVQKMKEGQWQEFMTGKWGIIDRVVTYGDAFGRVASFKNKQGLTDGEKEKIVTFQNTGTAKLYWGTFTTDVLNPGGEGEATECVALYTYPWERAIDLYPLIGELATVGKLPETEEGYSNDNMTSDQRAYIAEKKIELGFYYDKARRIYALVAGRTAAKIFEYKEKEYPFVFDSDNSPYLPFLHFFCFQGIEGLYNSGICGLFYALDAIWTELINRGTSYIMQNVDPIQIINLPPDKRAEFYQQVNIASEAQEVGGRPWIVNEMNDPNYGKIQSVQTASLTNDFERLIVQLKAHADMLGVKLDELMSAPGKPLGTTELELANQNETVKAIIDNWRNTIEFAVKITIDAIMRDIEDDDEEIVEGDVNVIKEKDGIVIRDEIGMPVEEKVKGVIMGDVAFELRQSAKRKVKINVVVNTASGAVKNDSLEMAMIQNDLALTPPGTLHYNNLRKRLAELRGFNVTNASFSNPQVQQAQIASIGGGAGAGEQTQKANRLELASPTA